MLNLFEILAGVQGTTIPAMPEPEQLSPVGSPSAQDESPDILAEEAASLAPPSEDPRRTVNAEMRRMLGHFTGTENYYRHRALGVRKPVMLTDGAHYVFECGELGVLTAYWLLDVITSWQGELTKSRRDISFQVWKLEVPGMREVEEAWRQDLPAPEGRSMNRGKVTCENGNGRVLAEQEIPLTDFPLSEITLYVTDEPDQYVVLLPSEW